VHYLIEVTSAIRHRPQVVCAIIPSFGVPVIDTRNP